MKALYCSTGLSIAARLSASPLRVACRLPLSVMSLAPVFVIELARTERRTGLRIVSWWITWFFSYVLSVASIVTTVLTIFYDGAQRIADNTVITTVAYLVAMAALLLMLQVYEGFERQPVDRPSRRWVMVTSSFHLATLACIQARSFSAVPALTTMRKRVSVRK